MFLGLSYWWSNCWGRLVFSPVMLESWFNHHAEHNYCLLCSLFNCACILIVNKVFRGPSSGATETLDRGTGHMPFIIHCWIVISETAPWMAVSARSNNSCLTQSIIWRLRDNYNTYTFHTGTLCCMPYSWSARCHTFSFATTASTIWHKKSDPYPQTDPIH